MKTCESPGFQTLVSRTLSRTRKAVALLALGTLLATSTGTAFATGTLRIAMTASDIPLPNGNRGNGVDGGLPVDP